MKIALLCPVRERMELNNILIRSLLTTIGDYKNVDLFFGVDEDDVETKNALEKYSEYIPWIKVVVFLKQDKFPGVGYLWNTMAMKLIENFVDTYEIVGMIGNDMVFKTPSWDLKIIEEFENHKDNKILMVHCEDGNQHGRVAVNSFIHSNYIKFTGYYVREEFKVDYIDTWLHQVHLSLGCCIFRPDILIQHNHWSFGKAKRDHIANRMIVTDGGESRNLWNTLAPIRIKEIEYLKTQLK